MRDNAPCDNPSICASVVRAIGPYCAMDRATRCMYSEPSNQWGKAGSVGESVVCSLVVGMSVSSAAAVAAVLSMMRSVDVSPVRSVDASGGYARPALGRYASLSIEFHS